MDFFGLFRRYKFEEQYRKYGNHLKCKHIGEYDADIFTFANRAEVQAHLATYDLRNNSGY